MSALIRPALALLTALAVAVAGFMGVAVPAAASTTVTPAWASTGTKPTGIVMDSSGNLYVTNRDSNSVTKIASDGTTTTSWASTGVRPNGIVIDSSDNIYVANSDSSAKSITKITPGGTASTWATFTTNVSNLAIDSSNTVYANDGGGGVVHKIASDGTVTDTWAHIAGTNPMPSAMAFGPSGDLFVINANSASQGGQSIAKISTSGVVTDNWVSFPSAQPNFGIAIDSSGNVFTANWNGSRGISKITSDGTLTETWVSWDGSNVPLDVVVDSSGNVYSTWGQGAADGIIVKVTADGTANLSWGATQHWPSAMLRDSSGDIYVANRNSNTVTKVVPDASQTITFANPGDQLLSSGSITLSATSDSGLTVSFAASGACTVSGTTLSLDALGTCTVTASQSGGSGYLPATDVGRSFEITTAPSGGGGGGVGGGAPAPAPAAPAPTATGTTAAALTWTPDSDREKYVSSGSGVEISAEALAPTGGKRAVDDGDAFALVDGDDIELDIKGLADDSTLTVSFTFADPDRPECAIKSQEIEVRSGTTLTESSIPFDPADQCVGEWTMTLEGQTSSSTAFKFTTPIVLAAKQLVTETLDAKASYFFKGRSDAFHTKSPRKLTRLANSVPEKADVTIAVTGVSVSLKGKKANKALAKKRCEQIEEFMREALPGHTLTFEHNPVGARKRGGDVSTDAILLRNKRGKPLTTVSVTYTTLR